MSYLHDHSIEGIARSLHIYARKRQIEIGNLESYLLAVMNRSDALPTQSEILHQRKLEYIGDAILELVTREFMVQFFPNVAISKITKLCRKIVSNKNLSLFAYSMHYDDIAQYNSKCYSLGQFINSKRFADSFEAFIGAIYTNHGAEVTRNFLFPSFFEFLNRQSEFSISYLDFLKFEASRRVNQDIEIVELKRLKDRYRLSLCLSGEEIGYAESLIKKDAKKHAAQNALLKMKWIIPSSR